MIDPALLRTCLACEHFYYRSAEPGYSEFTPSSPLDMSCAKRMWDFDPYMTDIREILFSAEKCEHYKFAELRAREYKWREK